MIHKAKRKSMVGDRGSRIWMPFQELFGLQRRILQRRIEGQPIEILAMSDFFFEFEIWLDLDIPNYLIKKSHFRPKPATIIINLCIFLDGTTDQSNYEVDVIQHGMIYIYKYISCC